MKCGNLFESLEIGEKQGEDRTDRVDLDPIWDAIKTSEAEMPAVDTWGPKVVLAIPEKTEEEKGTRSAFEKTSLESNGTKKKGGYHESIESPLGEVADDRGIKIDLDSLNQDQKFRFLAVTDGYKRGWSFTELNGKIPTVKGWQNKLRESLADAQEWALRGNVGLRTGPFSDVYVIDVDMYKGGKIPDGLPKTVMVKTGNGGFHLYFRHLKNLESTVFTG